MSELIKQHIDFIRFYTKASPLQQKSLLRYITVQQLQCLTEVTFNMLKGNIPLKADERKLLRRDSHHLRILGNPKKTFSQRKSQLKRLTIHRLLSISLPTLEDLVASI